MKHLFATLLLLFAFPSAAIASDCDEFYPNNTEIVVENTQVICKNFYAIVWDNHNVGNVFSTEVVQPDVRVPRKNAFRADPDAIKSPTPADYTNTGFDRGHMVPAANSSTPEQMSETFFMTNMTPQYPNVNRIAWRKLEASVRKMDFMWVVTGAHYGDRSLVIGENKVSVPTVLYKVVYLKDGSIIGYMIENKKENKEATEVDVSEIENLTGIKFK